MIVLERDNRLHNVSNMSRHLPKKIKIGYSVYKLRHVVKKLDIDKAKRKGRNVDMGECDFSAQTLRVFGKQGSDEFANTVLHEILHAINEVHKIRFKNERLEEEYVTRYADVLLTLFKDNPKLLLWFQDKLSKEKIDKK